jgi:hypothetical protein
MCVREVVTWLLASNCKRQCRAILATMQSLEGCGFILCAWILIGLDSARLIVARNRGCRLD